MPVPEQMAVLLAATEGLFDDVSLDEIAQAERRIREAVADKLPEAGKRIEEGEKLDNDDREALLQVARSVLDSKEKEASDADT